MLHDSLMARLDRMSSVKDLIQLGAVIGREFSWTLVAKVASMSPAQLEEDLEKLVGAEFEHAQALYDEKTDRRLAFEYSFDPGLGAISNLAYMNWETGRFDARARHVGAIRSSQ